MGVKIKNRDPRSTDLRADDIIINNKEGSIFYKGNGRLYKLKGDDVKTPTTESNMHSFGIITAVSGAFSYITASVIDVDAETIRFGGIPFGKNDVQSLNAGLFPTTTVVARTSQGDDDRDYNQYIKPQAIFSPVDDSTYAKYTTAGRVGQFVGGTLFFDQNRNGDNNYIALGAANTQIRITGTLTASIDGGSF